MGTSSASQSVEEGKYPLVLAPVLNSQWPGPALCREAVGPSMRQAFGLEMNYL